MQTLQRLRRELTLEQVRAQLGGFGFSARTRQHDQGRQPVGRRAGAADAGARHAWTSRNLLILDEPTNHLDIDAREELLTALNDFDGAVILVSHDRRLIEATADRLLLVADGGVDAVRRRPGRLSPFPAVGRKHADTHVTPGQARSAPRSCTLTTNVTSPGHSFLRLT